jgi:hypothetical protein
MVGLLNLQKCGKAWSTEVKVEQAYFLAAFRKGSR